MKPDAVQLVASVVDAATFAIRWTDGKTVEDYIRDPYMRSAVERQFIVIGEAVNQLRAVEPSTAARISDFRSVIAFRNVLVHGFFQVNHHRVWSVIEEHAPTLLREASALLDELEDR